MKKQRTCSKNILLQEIQSEILMENCLLTHFIFNNEIKSSCDYNQFEQDQYIGVYEVIRVIDGLPLFLEDHISRFYTSLKLNNINTLVTERQIKSRIRALIEVNKLSIGNIRFQLLSNINGNYDFYAMVIPFFYPTKEEYESGVDCDLFPATRNNPNSKTTNLSFRELTENQIRTNNIFELILFNEQNQISEGSRSNLFFIDKNILYTSPDTEVLLGVTRKKIINICETKNIVVKKLLIKTTEISGFNSAFLSGTSINILAVKAIGSSNFNTLNPVLLLLTNEYEKLLNEYLNTFKWNL